MVDHREDPGGAAAESDDELVRQAVDALGREDPEAFAELVDPDVEIHTARGVRRGRDAAVEWASKRYDHLIRRWGVDEIRQFGHSLLVLGCVQYVWREDGEVGDETPTSIGFEVRDGSISALRIYESVQEGIDAFVASQTTPAVDHAEHGS